MGLFGAPGRIRTSGPQIRSLMLKKPTTGRRRMISGTAYGSRTVAQTRGRESTNHIVSAIEDRNELCTDCVIRNGYSRYRCPTVSTLVRTRPPSCTPVYWTFVDPEREIYAAWPFVAGRSAAGQRTGEGVLVDLNAQDDHACGLVTGVTTASGSPLLIWRVDRPVHHSAAC